MPKLWDDSIEAHRRAVHEATLDATAALVREHGLRGVTMSQIAETTGIGRATLYKYFASVEEILHAWHHRQVTAHLNHLQRVRDHATSPGRRIEAVLHAYAMIAFEHRDAELGSVLHRGDRLTPEERQLSELLEGVLEGGVRAGVVRADVRAGELATYCVAALSGARSLPSKAAAGRLVEVVLGGLRAG